MFVVTMQFKPEELTAIVNDFNEPGSLAPTGLHIASTKDMVIQGAVIRGKKVRTIISLLLIPDACSYTRF